MPLEENDFEVPVELAGNRTGGLLGTAKGPADQGCICVDAKDVLHAVWRRPARDGSDELWYARCALSGKMLQRQLSGAGNWQGLESAGGVPVRVDLPGNGSASLGDIAVTPDGGVWIAYSQGWPGERRVVLASPAGSDWKRAVMTDRWDFRDPVLDVDESGIIHLAYGPEASDAGAFCTVDFGEFHPRFVHDPREMAERYGVYYTQSRDGYHFVRVADGQKLIARGELGEWDAQFVSNANTLVTVEGQILIYYAGTRQPNLLGHPSNQFVIENATYGQTGLARLPVDAFTYLRVRPDRSETPRGKRSVFVSGSSETELDSTASGFNRLECECEEIAASDATAVRIQGDDGDADAINGLLTRAPFS